MQQQIKIAVLDIDQGDESVYYAISLSNGVTMGALEFYDYSDAFKEFASKLLTFPTTIDETVIFEIGEDNEKWKYYMLLKVFCYEQNGYTAIQVVIDNHQPSPDTVKTEFYIKTVPASINNLGKLLSNWDPKTKEIAIWNC